MKKYKGNIGLLDKDRFARQNKEHEVWLMNLSLNEAILLQEKLVSSVLIKEWQNNFFEDTPVSLDRIIRKRV